MSRIGEAGHADLFGYVQSPPTAPSGYAGGPGWRDPETSREAAQRIAPHASRLRAQVLAVIKEFPGLSVHQIAARLNMPVPTVQPRISELRRASMIEPTGQRHRNESGASAHCWRAVSIDQIKQQASP
jgi:predicted transcriptional regulator